MNGNIHNSRGSSTRLRKPAARWCTVFIALVLALAIGSVGQTSPAQAAPASLARNKIEFRLGVAPVPPPVICVNKPLSFYVDVVKTTHTSFGVGDNTTPLTSFVTGDVNGYVTKGNGEVLGVLREAGESQSQFIFKSDKPGVTTLRFTAFISNSWIGANEELTGSIDLLAEEVTVKVGCKVKVNTVSSFKAGMTSVGTMDGEMRADEQGNFTGSATVNWVTSMLCGISSPIDPSQADLTGTFNESGQLVGQVTFGSMSSSGGGNCGPASVATSNFGTLDPLTIKASSDGVSVYTQAQTVTATNGSFTGTATIVVIPEEEEAAAFNPGDLQARWDDFSSLFGALLALH